MRKIFKKTCGLALGVAMVLSATGCEGNSAENDVAEKINVWGAYSTAKVTANVKASVPYEVLDASVNIEMMKNETEGGQIVVTAKEAVDSYELIAADLSDGNGHTISKSDISVYHQKYMRINNESDILNKDYVAGDYVPDMLLPMETAKAYGENKIEAGKNQGITIEVTTTHDTVPGTYTGKFTLNADGATTEIPVTVTVWNIEYEGKREFKSSFLVYRNCMVAGEYDASDDILYRYEDFLLKYKVNSFFIKSTYTVEETVNDMIRLFDNDNYNSIVIPKFLQTGYKSTDKMAGEIVDYIVGVVKKSTPEKNYADYLYLYPAAFDEADQFESTHADVVNVFKKGGEWDKTLANALAAVKETEEYQAFSADFKAEIDDIVLNIPAVFTNCTFKEDWVETSHVAFCPYISLFGDDANLAKYQEAAETNSDDDLWVYTCVKPNYPNPTFHLDDYNLGTRISGWMEKKWHVNGYLYYLVNTYQAINNDTWRSVNPYETAERATYCAGDGFLVYPGKYYGSEYPFASLRLVAYRDSMDDYDMLSVYEDLLEEKAEKYGIEADADKYLADLYDSLFVGSSYYTDDSLVVEARRELAARILALQGEDGIMAIGGANGLTVYSAKSSLTINGSKVNGTASGEGYKYTVTGTTGNVTIAGATTTYTATVKENAVAATLTAASEVKATESSTATATNGTATFTVKSVYRSSDETIDGATRRYKPYAQISVKNAAKATGFDFEITNSGENNIEFVVQLIDKDGVSYDAGSVYVKAGETKSVHITLDANVFTETLTSGVTAVRFSFTNLDAAGTALAADRTFTVKDMRFYK